MFFRILQNASGHIIGFSHHPVSVMRSGNDHWWTMKTIAIGAFLPPSEWWLNFSSLWQSSIQTWSFTCEQSENSTARVENSWLLAKRTKRTMKHHWKTNQEASAINVMSASSTCDHFLSPPETNIALVIKQQSFKICHNWLCWSVVASNYTASIHATLGTGDLELDGFCRTFCKCITLHMHCKPRRLVSNYINWI